MACHPRPPGLVVALAVLCVCLSPAAAHEMPSHPGRGADAHNEVRAVYREHAPTIDGLIQEGESDDALHLVGFHQAEPIVGDLSIDNFSVVYRMQHDSGQQLYVILGDPQGDRTTPQVAVKFVRPFPF